MIRLCHRRYIKVVLYCPLLISETHRSRNAEQAVHADRLPLSDGKEGPGDDVEQVLLPLPEELAPLLHGPLQPDDGQGALQRDVQDQGVHQAHLRHHRQAVLLRHRARGQVRAPFLFLLCLAFNTYVM